MRPVRNNIITISRELFQCKGIAPAARGRLALGAWKPMAVGFWQCANGDVVGINGDGQLDWVAVCRCSWRFYYTSRLSIGGKAGKSDKAFGKKELLPEEQLCKCPECGRWM